MATNSTSRRNRKTVKSLDPYKMSEILKKGTLEGLIRFDGTGTNRYVFYPFQAMRFRWEPEEEVRAWAYIKLVLEKKYDPNKITFERKVKMGSSYRFVDIVIFSDHQHQNDEIIIECKRANVGKRAFLEAVEQGKSYDNQLYGKYIWVTSQKKNTYYKVKPSKNGRDYVEIDDLPSFSTSAKFTGALSETIWTVKHSLKAFYKNYIVPQTQKPWVSNFLLFTFFFVFIGFMVSWFNAKVITAQIDNHTRWLVKGRIHYGHLYWVVPILTTLVMMWAFKRKLFPKLTEKRTARNRKKKGKELPFVFHNKVIFATLIVVIPSLVLSELLFGTGDICRTCCIDKWFCWWSRGHYYKVDESWRMMNYFVPFVMGVPVQSIMMIILNWVFEAFSRLR
ncbi:type I restriction enzyme HsdR N-terminal domain-containing protein [Bernardetia sp.]|uniref:type I restriction enzyme HsdR N-terminal domain-containing protein n=1 Tax=Bernardetia sp. TaxID=1937974 RepID=UPI0025BBD3BA|nr:type I restriction enzyme HsdR N-terminal domain-containing protein [Bernardetia sp.]